MQIIYKGLKREIQTMDLHKHFRIIAKTVFLLPDRPILWQCSTIMYYFTLSVCRSS